VINIWRLVNWGLRIFPNILERVGLETFCAMYLKKWRHGPIDISMDKQKALAFFVLMEKIVMPMWMKTVHVRGAGYLVVAEEPPFFGSLVFRKHSDLCWSFKDEIQKCGQVHYEALVQVCWNKGGSQKKDLEPLYTDPKTLILFLKQVMQRMGLWVQGFKAPLLRGKMYRYRVVSLVRDLTVAMCLGETRKVAIETLFAEMNNRSPWGQSQSCYREAAQKYHKVCDTYGVDPRLEV
jgi:hypothetical protein